MKKWLKIVLIIFTILFILILSILSYTYYRFFYKTSFSESRITKAEELLSIAPSIEDPKDDWIYMNDAKKGSENNPEPYPLSYSDVKSLSLASDGEYLYFKQQMWGVFPKKQESIGGDPIRAVGMKFHIVTESGADISIIQSAAEYMASFLPPRFGFYTLTDSTGITWPEEDRFARQSYSGYIYGKAGLDYIILAIPLEEFKIPYDKTFYVAYEIETASRRYTHATVDILLGSGKMPAILKINLKNNTLEILGNTTDIKY